MTIAIELKNNLSKLEQRRAEVKADREQTAIDLDQAHARLITQGPVTRAINDVSVLQARLAALDGAMLALAPQIAAWRRAKRDELAIEERRIERQQRAARLVEIAAARANVIEDYYEAASAAGSALNLEVDRMREAFALFYNLGQEGRTLWQLDNERIPSDHLATRTEMPGREVEHGIPVMLAYQAVEKKLFDAALKKTNEEREVTLAEERLKNATPLPELQEPAPPIAPWLTNRVQGWESR